MLTLATIFCTILSGVREAIGAYMHRRAQPGPPAVWLGTRLFVPVQPPPPATPPIPDDILTLAWTRIGRMARRFAQLYERWKSNTLPKPRPSRAGQTRPRQTCPDRPKRLYLPTRPSWLIGAVGFKAANHASQLNHLLARPDAQEFLTAVPRAGRILRPLCRMLGIAVPAPLVLPPKPRAPRKRPEKPPREPTRHGKYTVAQARRYSPGRIPESIPKPA